jgi:hypothetical protein
MNVHLIFPDYKINFRNDSTYINLVDQIKWAPQHRRPKMASQHMEQAVTSLRGMHLEPQWRRCTPLRLGARAYKWAGLW